MLSTGASLDLADLPAEYGGRPPAGGGVSAAPQPVPPTAAVGAPAAAAGSTPAADDGPASAAPTYEAGLPMAELEKRHILKTLENEGNNRTRAARVLGIGRRTLQRKLEEYKEEGEEIPPPAPD